MTSKTLKLQALEMKFTSQSGVVLSVQKRERVQVSGGGSMHPAGSISIDSKTTVITDIWVKNEDGEEKNWVFNFNVSVREGQGVHLIHYEKRNGDSVPFMLYNSATKACFPIEKNFKFPAKTPSWLMVWLIFGLVVNPVAGFTAMIKASGASVYENSYWIWKDLAWASLAFFVITIALMIFSGGTAQSSYRSLFFSSTGPFYSDFAKDLDAVIDGMKKRETTGDQ